MDAQAAGHEAQGQGQSAGRHAARCAATAVIGIAMSLASASAGELWCATATTMEKKDAAVAGAELAAKAKEACQGRTPKFVLVFGGPDWSAEGMGKLLAGLGQSFDRKTLYGATYCLRPSLNAAITRESNQAMAAVLVLGGDINVTAVMKTPPDKTKDEAAFNAYWKEGPPAIAEALKAPYTDAAGKGRLILLFGACAPFGAAQKYMAALTKTLGKDAPMFGGATTGNGFVYYQGEAFPKSVLAVLLTGDFSCGFGMAQAAAIDPKKVDIQKPESVAETASRTASLAVGEPKDNAVCLLVACCCSRYASLLRAKAVPSELKALTEATSVPIVGFYAEGEIGQAAADQPAVAGAERISACAIRKTPARAAQQEDR